MSSLSIMCVCLRAHTDGNTVDSAHRAYGRKGVGFNGYRFEARQLFRTTVDLRRLRMYESGCEVLHVLPPINLNPYAATLAAVEHEGVKPPTSWGMIIRSTV